jgi:hypothetical protein
MPTVGFNTFHVPKDLGFHLSLGNSYRKVPTSTKR